MKYKTVQLLKGKEYPIKNGHHWIYSGAIHSSHDFENGDILEVRSSSNDILGYGYFNRDTSIAGRLLSFGKKDPIDQLRENIQNAYELREKLFDSKKTNCYRLINGEGDRIPGLIVDRYDNTLVIQVSTLGIEKLKDTILAILVDVINPDQIYEKSNMPARKHEGMQDLEVFLYSKSEEKSIIEVLENSMRFQINLPNSHKTGFYLDQREMRNLIREMANKKQVLNCFSYTGGFSVAAALGGATKVASVDISQEVIEQAKVNFELNNLKVTDHEFVASDVFEYFQQQTTINEQLIILDPPAFAKKKQDYERACNGYRKLNRLAMQKMKSGSFLLTCSCSYHVDEESFQRILVQAANEANRKVQIIHRHRMAMDHLINIFHPEMGYLKSYVLYVT